MTYIQIIRKEMEKRKLNCAELTEKCGYVRNNRGWRIANGKTRIKLCDFLHVMDCLGYEVVVRPKGKYRTKYKLTEGEEE